MPFMINILNMKTNGVTQNGNIDIGATVHNSHTANTKFVGGNISLGDCSFSNSLMGNQMLDTDVSDQDQIMNPSLPMTYQI
ncbi:spore germination protein [Bacillus xiapuensis]|uniref:spore germination protein n=1 Tax=Bacillus xiapuensis TaxID=2014075 RepID=UPI000C241F07|nr:spore germination protein [Bacillus xiapuensis]